MGGYESVPGFDGDLGAGTVLVDNPVAIRPDHGAAGRGRVRLRPACGHLDRVH
jgi:hypothetical protein